LRQRKAHVSSTHELHEIVIVGAGAAGLMAACWAANAASARRVVVLDGARTLGAKILMSGGGRCNVTHEHVDPEAYSGSSRPSIRKVIRRFDVPETVAFFEKAGVRLKQEANGKLFPVTDDAKTVLTALIQAVHRAGVDIRHPCRVESATKDSGGFLLAGPWGKLRARRVILATGGRSYPKTGSDGHGYEIAQSLGHSTEALFPALVPLTLPRGHIIKQLSGLAVEATLTVVSATGEELGSCTGSTLCAHFGLSGPAVLDVSRHYLAAKSRDPEAHLLVNWLPGLSVSTLEKDLLTLTKSSVAGYLGRRLPDRLVAALCSLAGVDTGTRGHQLQRDQRQALVRALTELRLPVTGQRGFDHAEVTAGGVPLREIRPQTMESRICPGLYLCGEICDVDGPIGGFNFQWAWASGFVAGVGAAQNA
jgi:predicted Rossmann fold flavoprotein